MIVYITSSASLPRPLTLWGSVATDSRIGVSGDGRGAKFLFILAFFHRTHVNYGIYEEISEFKVSASIAI